MNQGLTQYQYQKQPDHRLSGPGSPQNSGGDCDPVSYNDAQQQFKPLNWQKPQNQQPILGLDFNLELERRNTEATDNILNDLARQAFFDFGLGPVKRSLTTLISPVDCGILEPDDTFSLPSNENVKEKSDELNLPELENLQIGLKAQPQIEFKK